MNLHTIGFFIASNAVPAQVEALIEDIEKYFSAKPATDNSDGVPSTSLAPPTGVQTDAELDSNGIPWDHRIHASTKNKNGDGTWKALRGVDKTLAAQITAQLKAAVGATGSAPEASKPALTLPSKPALTLPNLTTVSPYQKLLADVGVLVQQGHIDDAWLNQISDYVGVTGGFVNLAHATPEVIAQARAAVTEAIAPAGLSL